MRRLIVVVALLSLACGGSNSPTAPAPMPTANLNSTGMMTFDFCNSPLGCTFEGEAANGGAGCAANVRGVSRLFNQAGTETGRAEWSLVSSRRIRPGEKFLYSGCCFAFAAANAPGTYKTDISWDNVGC